MCYKSVYANGPSLVALLEQSCLSFFCVCVCVCLYVKNNLFYNQHFPITTFNCLMFLMLNLMEIHVGLIYKLHT
jgi:hypothetical protein